MFGATGRREETPEEEPRGDVTQRSDVRKMPERPRKERAENAEKRRGQIIDATCRSIVRNGLSGTTLASVSAEADLSHWELGEVLDWDPDPDKSEFHQRWHAWQDAIGFDRPTFELKHPET